MISAPESNGCDEVMLGAHSTHAKIHITSCLCFFLIFLVEILFMFNVRAV